MADTNPEDVRATIDALVTSLAKYDPTSADKFRKAINKATDSLDEIPMTAEEVAKALKKQSVSLDKLSEEYKKGKKTYATTVSDLNSLSNAFERMDDAAKASEAGQKIIAKRAEIGSKLAGEVLSGGVAKVAGSLAVSAIDAFKQLTMVGIRGVQGEGSATSVAASLMNAGIDSAAKAASGVAGAAGTVGSALSAIPTPATQVAGALISLASGIINAGIKEAAEVAKFAIEVVSKELEKTTKSFAQATSAGALFAGGLTELRDTAKKAGVTQEQFSTVIASNSIALAQIGGSVTDGAKKVGEVTTKFSDGTKKNLLKLGVSIEDQIQGTADYMSLLQSTGNLRGRSDKQLAEESANYMVNLKAIAAFTGEDVKAAAKRAKEAAQQGAVKAKLDSMGADANAKFQNAIKNMSPAMQKAAQQMLVYGQVTDSESAMALAQMPDMMGLLGKTIKDVGDTGVTTNQALDNYQKNIKESGPAIKSQAKSVMDSMGLVNLATGRFSDATNLASGAYDQSIKAGEMGAKTTRETAIDAMTTQDALTQGVVDSTIALQEMRVSIQDKLTPYLTKFAEMMPAVLAGLDQMLKDVGLSLGKQAGRTTSYANTATPLTNASGMDFSGGSFADGGIARGPTSGHMNMLHGVEAVVPLPNGNSIPVDVDLSSLSGPFSGIEAMVASLLSLQSSGGMDSLIKTLQMSTQSQLDKHDEMISILGSNRDYTQQLVNNSY